MDALFGIVKTGAVIAVVVLALLAAAVIYGLHLHRKDLRREQRDKILNSSLDDLAEKKLESTDASGQPVNKNPYSNRPLG